LEAGPFSQVLYPIWPAIDSDLPTLFPAETEKNSLIPHRFGSPTPPRPERLLHCTREDFPEEFTGELSSTL
jgi:hypothetical protein